MLRKIADFLTGKDIDRRADAINQAAEQARIEAFNEGVSACAERLRGAGEDYERLEEVYASLGCEMDRRLARARCEIAYDLAIILEKLKR